MTVQSHPSLPAGPPSFHADDVEQFEGYRTLSPLAIVCLLLGLAAPACFLGPFLLVVPLFGAVLSIFTLRRIAASEGRIGGRVPATIGLVLCVACLLANFSFAAVTQHLRTGQATDFGRQWITLLTSGNVEQAYRLTLNGSQPRPTLAEPPPGPKPEDPYVEFGENPLVKTLASFGEGANVRFDETLGYDDRSYGQYDVRQRFLVTPASSDTTDAKSGRKPVDVTLTVRRTGLAGRSRSSWLTLNFVSEAVPASAEHRR